VSTVSTLLVPHAASSVAAARQAVADDLSRRGCDRGAVEDTVLVLSEVLSNALKHARPLPSGQVRVRWALGLDSVEISVTDGGSSTRPRASSVSMSATGGRGLSIVTRLSADWGVRQEGPQTTVWAQIPLPSSSLEV
jgi:anti-sigma regulatory factor (Ser/Thr protein kinase)